MKNYLFLFNNLHDVSTAHYLSARTIGESQQYAKRRFNYDSNNRYWKIVQLTDSITLYGSAS